MRTRRAFTARLAWWFPAVSLLLMAGLIWTPVVATGADTMDGHRGTESSHFTSGLAAAGQAETDSDKTTVIQTEPAPADPVPELTVPALKRFAPLPAEDKLSKAGSRVRRASTRAYTAPRRGAPAKKTSSGTSSSKASAGNELSQARAILASLRAQYPVLAGATVAFGATPGGYQAVCYYKSGRILVNPNHRASLRTILTHEVWHIIDWRDNSRIDWGENVPRR